MKWTITHNDSTPNHASDNTPSIYSIYSIYSITSITSTIPTPPSQFLHLRPSPVVEMVDLALVTAHQTETVWLPQHVASAPPTANLRPPLQTFSTTRPPAHLPALSRCRHYPPKHPTLPSAPNHPPLPVNPPYVRQPSANLHPHRTSDLARGRQAPCSGTPTRAANLRPRLRPPRPQASGRTRPDLHTKRSQPHGPQPTYPLYPVAAITLPNTPHSPQPPTTHLCPSTRHTSASPPPTSTHTGPPTSHGAARLRAAARQRVLRTSDLA